MPCSFEHRFDIDENSQIPAIEVKTTHRYGSITELLEGSLYGERFAGGTFVHYMLPPSAYHRFHSPVAGLVKESFVRTGRVYMQVDIDDHELNSRDNPRPATSSSKPAGSSPSTPPAATPATSAWS